MTNMDSERGVQVVSIKASGSYQLDEEALAALLLSEEVADCRVALVSVAGAFRGGKSFLLDFMLRYLRAEEGARTDGSWLGAEREELGGFNWRGGSERDTTGLLLWSRPARAALPSGEQVAVLLMDTQGTFDSRSTVRDCSTIFALSTLLSSVQIYNLKDNIREDDLQHLQLFTEYGRMALASNDGSKPFQSLQFLVRDWSCWYEHAYGAEGGKELLEKRLKIDGEDAAELQGLRQHIRACFDSLGCFLMPHPGFAICEFDFQGHLADIRQEFKDSLKELVPLILHPKNLKVKEIHGQPMTGRELFCYFKEYMKMFNGDELPLPLTIMKATAEACLLSGVATAREKYRRAMGHAHSPAVARDSLRERHARARDDAVQAFVDKKTMAEREKVDGCALQLTQEFDALLRNYELLNDAKIQKAVANAKQKYNKMLLGEYSMEHLCLHPRDLTEAHRRGMESAISELVMYTAEDQFADDQKDALVKDLLDRYKIFSASNESNNRAAVAAALEDYCTFIESTCGMPPCVTSMELTRCMKKARAFASDTFKARRNRYIEYHDDLYMNKLKEAIEEQKLKLQAKNEENNENAVQEAINAYKTYMGPEVNDDRCYHPKDLEQEDENGRNRAFNVFASRSTAPRNHVEDGYKQNLREALDVIFHEIKATNVRSNINAVIESFNEYCKHANFHVNILVDWFSILRGIRLVNQRHVMGVAAALDTFQRKRHTGLYHLTDQYRQCLEKVIQERHQYDNYAHIYRIFVAYHPPWSKSGDWWSKSLDDYLSMHR